MAIKYERQEIITLLDQAKHEISTFYQQDFMNYSGKTIDTKEFYTEVVAEWIMGHASLFDGMQKITRMSSYKMKTHQGWTTRPSSNRQEERMAMRMFRQKDLPCLGLVLDYQTPLKDKRASQAGKIDLLTYDGNVLRIMELKKKDSSETMLRCALEGYTYLKTVDVNKLLQDFELPQGIKVQACPLVSQGQLQYREMKSHRPHLKRLMEMLDIKPFFYIEHENMFEIVEK